jgi:hypothetical protein
VSAAIPRARAYNIGYPRGRDAQIQRQLVHAEAQGLHEFFAQNLAKM